jgi:membrane protein
LNPSRAWSLFVNAISGLARHRGTQLAASMAYYALFSIFPTAIVLIAVLGLLLDSATVQTDVVDFLLDSLPLSDDPQSRADLEDLVVGATSHTGALGIFGGVTLLISASALVSATRNSIDTVFAGEVTRGALRGKGLDVLLVLGIGLLFILSFAATIVTQFDLGPDNGVIGVLETILSASGIFLPLALGTIVFSVAYTVLPVERQKLSDVWPGVLFAVVAYELVKWAFSFYLDNFANYDAIYGSLGAVMAFMFFVYLASVVFLLGAEIAHLWPQVRRGGFDPDDDDEGKPFTEQGRDFARSLFRRNPVDR